MKESKKLAKRIVKQLFTNGVGERAKRLVLELADGRDGGGWCPGAVQDVIEKVLEDKEK